MERRVAGSSWGERAGGGWEERLRQGRGHGLYEGGMVGWVGAVVDAEGDDVGGL